MTKIYEDRKCTPKDMLQAGWVLLMFDLHILSWIGKDKEGNTYYIDDQLPCFETVRFNIFQCYRCKPEKLMEGGARRIPMRNAADNRG